MNKIMPALRIVFAQKRYAALGVVLFASMLVLLLATSEYLFFEPYLVAHIPDGGVYDLVLLVAISALSSVVVPCSICTVMYARAAKRALAGSLTGTTIGVAAGACSCGPLGFILVSSLGATGIAASSFLNEYTLPLRLGALAALAVSLYVTSGALLRECKM